MENQLSFIGTQKKELLQFKPAEIYIEEHIREMWACKNCEAEADKANIKSDDCPKTLSNWIINSATELAFVYNCMKYNLLKISYVHADETPIKVIDSKGKESKSKHYMWVYVFHREDSWTILYDYKKTQSSSCPTKFLEGFSG